MKRSSLVAVVALAAGALLMAGLAWADDPFAGGADALAVTESDGSASLRAKKKLKKMKPDMVMVQVKGIDDSKVPNCVITGRVLKDAKSDKKWFKLIGRGKTYKFAPVYKKRRGRLLLKNDMNQNNLGACYYPPRTRLIIKVTGVNRKAKTFKAGEIYLK
jgi:hypothetical protein